MKFIFCFIGKKLDSCYMNFFITSRINWDVVGYRIALINCQQGEWIGGSTSYGRVHEMKQEIECSFSNQSGSG